MSDDSSPVPDGTRERLLRASTDLCYCSERLERERKREGKVPTTPPGELHDAEREVLAPLLDDGFELVGTGAGRCVLRFPVESPLSGSVVKLARFGDDLTNAGIVQNHREVVLWSRHGDTDRWPLLPVTAFHQERYRWLTMPYGEPITDRDEEKRRTLVRDVQNQLVMLPEFDLREVREENVVLTDDGPFLADYGRPEGY